MLRRYYAEVIHYTQGIQGAFYHSCHMICAIFISVKTVPF